MNRELRIDVLTLFPDAFRGPLDVSIIQRARDAGLLDLHLHDIREHAPDKHRTVDDYPFGGGHGMVLRVDVLVPALEHVQSLAEKPGYVIYLSPQGDVLNDALVRQLAAHERLILVAGRYEGVDERFVEHCVDRQVSIGDYILTGGELPAMVLIDAVARHIPGALGDEASPEDESFANGLLEHPHYTRPAEYRGWTVPDVLSGGNHALIEACKQDQRLARTAARRDDLMDAQRPSLRAIDEIDEMGDYALHVSFQMLKRRWFELKRQDRETGLRLMFIAWYAAQPPGATGIAPGEDTGITLRSVFKQMGGEKSDDAEMLFVAGQLLGSGEGGFLLAGTDAKPDKWTRTGHRCLARARELRPRGFAPQHFAGRGAMGAYFARMLRDDGWTLG